MAHPVDEAVTVAKVPFLEDVSIKGPLRLPVANTMRFIEERDLIEADWRWYRYSRFAPFWLILCLLILVTIFAMTAAEQAGSLKDLPAKTIADPSVLNGQQASEFRAPWGVPRTIVNASSSVDQVEGLSEVIILLRVATIALGLGSIILIFAWLWVRPMDPARMLVNWVFALALLAVCISAFIILAQSADKIQGAKRCPWDTPYGKCRSLAAVEILAVASEVAIGLFALISAALLFWYSVTGDWRLQQEDLQDQEEDKQQKSLPSIISHWIDSLPRHRNMDKVRRNVLAGSLLITFGALIVLAVCALIFSNAQPKGYGLRPYQRGNRGRNLYEEAGWPARNTNLRYAYSSIGILAILANLLPFANRMLAYAYAYLYVAVAIMSLVAFGLDLHEVQQAYQLDCPTGMDCKYAAYISVIASDMLIGLLLIFYVLYEYVAKRFTESRWSGRHYCPHEIYTHDEQRDSMRPVRDKTTGDVMTAKEYVYRYQYLRPVKGATGGSKNLVVMIPVEQAEQQFVPPPPLTIPEDVPHPMPLAIAPVTPKGVISHVPSGMAPPVMIKQPVIQRTTLEPHSYDEASSSSQLLIPFPQG